MDSVELSYRELSGFLLEEIIDAEALDELFEDFSRITGYPVMLSDVNGKVLIEKNKQDICKLFHQCNPETQKNCLESNSILSFGVKQGEVRQYKCKNSLWDIATPIYVKDKQMGNIFIGQFFYDDEVIDYDLFINQAERYGFDLEKYMEALKNVPMFEREKLNEAIKFNSRLADIISNMGYNNIVLSKLLKERKIQLEESQNKINTLFKSMNELVLLFEVFAEGNGNDPTYLLKDCNDALLRDFNLEKDLIIDKPVSELGFSGLEESVKRYSEVLMTGEPHEHFEYIPYIDKSFIVSVVPVNSRQFLTIYTDISEIKQMQEQLVVKNKELENYLYVASHDLRSPLVNIQGFSQRLKKQTDKIQDILKAVELEKEEADELNDILQKDIPRTLEFVFNNVQKMDGLIKGLLIISRTGRADMNIHEIDMNKLFEKIFFEMNYILEKHHIDFITDDLPKCFGDYELLNRLFSNIIDNAVKYRDPLKEMKIRIMGEKRYKYSIYRVEDNGIGMAQRHLEKIWDIFYRIDPVNSEGGEGLGLSIVKRIVDKHKGRVFVESTEGEGTSFRFELPNEMFPK